MPLKSLRELLIDQMRDTLSAEKQLVKALPKVVAAVTYEPLAQAVVDHLGETKEQVTRLERCFELLGETPRAKKCKGMEGLIEEAKEHLDEEGEGAVVDAAIVAAAQRVEHYEIAAYGCMIQYAELLGHDDVAKLLNESLEEEKAADKKLTEVSVAEVLSSAAAAGAEAGTR